SEIEPDIPLIELGVDSLAAIELMNWLNKTYNATLSQTQILSGASARTMVDAVADSGLVSDEAPSEVDIVPVLDEPLEPMPVVPVSTPSPAAQPTPEIREAPAIVAIEPAQPNEGFVDVPLEPPPILVAGHREVIVPAKLRGDTMDRLLADLADTRQPIVLRRDPNEEHFCIGMDLEAANFGDQSMSAGLEQYEKLAALMNDAEMPIIALIDGACRGGGMLFPSLATIVIATDEASFGFPEIRVGGLPGLVSVYAQNRLSRAACQRYMLTGDVLDPESAYRAGLVDFIGDADASEKELQRHLRRFQTIDPQLLTEARQALPAETPELAMIAMGGLDRRAKDRERDERPLVRLMHQPSSGVAIIELNDPDFSNAIDWAIGDDLAKAIRAAKKLDPLRSVVLQGSGEHFCVGVNPYNFIRRTKQLPVLTAARVVHDIYHAFLSVRDLGVPVVCALHGKVMGGGMAAALIGDYRIAAADALFNYGNLPRGVCPGMTMSESLARNVGQAWATELYMNDFTLSADEAKAIGLINDVATDAAEAKLTALDLATRIAGYAPTGVRATTALMRPTVDPDRLARESVGIARCNIQGNAFAPGWKAEERRLGDAAISQKVAALTATPPSPGSGETSKVGLVVPPQQWDWDSEVRLDLTLGRERQRTSDRGECIFLTGATGFVGVFILSELLRRPNSTIVCLVRADTNDHARERVIAKLKTYGLWEERFSHRIEALAGDVGHTDLGLGEDVYSRLAERCDVVLHNGAMVDFTLELDALKRTNVEGVRNICRFAAAGVRSQLVHVSSLSVFSLYRFDGEATDLRPDPARLINGYARSKWLGEQIALLAWRQGLDVSVVRPGRVMGDGESGAS
ncbi:MAG: SDR family oxidoreductase, partial [Pseudomonadota bacterium]